MRKLVRGIVEYRKRIRPSYRKAFARPAPGQEPDALLLACSDSRVAPNLFASTEPGDLFAVRNVGHLITPYEGRGGSPCQEERFVIIDQPGAMRLLRGIGEGLPRRTAGLAGFLSRQGGA